MCSRDLASRRTLLLPFSCLPAFFPFSLLPKLSNLLKNRIAIGGVSWVWCPESRLVLWNVACESWKSFVLGEM